MSLLELVNIAKAYPGSEGGPVLKGINLALAPGEAVALLGPSGSGKTTLARIVQGIEKPDAGRVRFMGKVVSGPRALPKRSYFSRVQMVWQDPVAFLNPYLPVIDSVMEPMLAFGLGSKKACRKMAEGLMADLGLDPGLGPLRPTRLSGGQCQRIAIARALSVSPKLLICDEALVSLDLIHQVSIMRLLGRMQRERGLGLLFITHDRACARKLCSRMLWLDGGRIRSSS